MGVFVRRNGPFLAQTCFFFVPCDHACVISCVGQCYAHHAFVACIHVGQVQSAGFVRQTRMMHFTVVIRCGDDFLHTLG